jgi:hypothetical protein
VIGTEGLNIDAGTYPLLGITTFELIIFGFEYFSDIGVDAALISDESKTGNVSFPSGVKR